MDPIELSLFASRISAVCEEMGAVLRRAAFSPNIKDRLDYSCAIFDAGGELCAQAAHIPVHLGSMAYAMREVVNRVDWRAGDALILNDPFLGGTHLPDVTMLMPVMEAGRLLGFVANRAHHADIGGSAPGSMPLSTHIEDEGLLIPPTRIVRGGELDQSRFDQLLGSIGNPTDTRGDFAAQLSANQTGHDRLQALITDMGSERYLQGLTELNDYAARLAGSALARIPDGEYHYLDYLDDDGAGHSDLRIEVTVRIRAGTAHIDFSGSDAQVEGNVNCPLSVTAAGVFYVFRCLMPANTPATAGSLRPLSLHAPDGCLLNARSPAAVAAGNVETSSRVVDAVMGALAQALPDGIPAASQGSMNNLAVGQRDETVAWAYYETIGGGMGAGPAGPGLSGVQTHMTNTLNTPVEALEMNLPLRVRRYALRRGSGGRGLHAGGDGLLRELEFLAPARLTLLTERRRHRPWGLAGGQSGLPGRNRLNGETLAGKSHRRVGPGDRLSIETPGGGGWGRQP